MSLMISDMNEQAPSPWIATTILRITSISMLTCGVAWWIIFRMSTNLTLEDALITYRYAQNLGAGNGFVFNIGQPVLGTTTPLLTLYLAMDTATDFDIALDFPPVWIL